MNLVTKCSKSVESTFVMATWSSVWVPSCFFASAFPDEAMKLSMLLFFQEFLPIHQKQHSRSIKEQSEKIDSLFRRIDSIVETPRIVIEYLGRAKAAKALALRLWFSFVMKGNDCMHLNDIREVLGPESYEIAEECFEMLDPDGNGEVSLEEATTETTELSLYRKNIAPSMHDVS